jgi:hypothetical protein
MTTAKKKFNKEIASLDELSKIPDPLSSQEMEKIKQNILRAITGTCPPTPPKPPQIIFSSLKNSLKVLFR